MWKDGYNLLGSNFFENLYTENILLEVKFSKFNLMEVKFNLKIKLA